MPTWHRSPCRWPWWRWPRGERSWCCAVAAAASVATLGLAAAVGVLVTVLVRVGEVSQTAGSMLAGGSARTDLETTTTAWPYVACVGAVLAAAAFVVALRSAAGWPEMSRRYDAPAAGSGPAAGATDGDAAPADLWRALDEGRDPTD